MEGKTPHMDITHKNSLRPEDEFVCGTPNPRVYSGEKAVLQDLQTKCPNVSAASPNLSTERIQAMFAERSQVKIQVDQDMFVRERGIQIPVTGGILPRSRPRFTSRVDGDELDFLNKRSHTKPEIKNQDRTDVGELDESVFFSWSSASNDMSPVVNRGKQKLEEELYTVSFTFASSLSKQIIKRIIEQALQEDGQIQDLKIYEGKC